MLASVDLINILCKIISKSKETTRVNLAVIVMQRLIEGPNKACQDILLDQFTKVETIGLFVALEKLIMGSLDSILFVVEEMALFNLNKNLRGNSSRVGLERVQVNMEIEHFDSKIDFIINTFVLVILLMKANPRGREFMRHSLIQESGQQTFNVSLIVFSVKIFSRLLKSYHTRCIRLADTILDFLLETIIGPSPDNQEEVMKTNFPECVKELLNEYSEGIDLVTTTHIKENKQLRDLCSKSVIVIKYLLEGNRNYEHNRQLIANLFKPQHLLAKIKDDLYEYLQQSEKTELKSFTIDKINRVYSRMELIDEALTDIFEQFFVLKIILDQPGAERELATSMDPDEKTTFDFLEAHSGSIEVLFENQIHKVYLEIQPMFRYLSEEERSLVTNTVRRDTPKNKIIDFMNMTPMIFDLISYKAGLNSTAKVFSEKAFRGLERMNYLLIMTINLLVLILFTKRLDFGFMVTDETFDESHPVMITLVNLHLIATVLRVLVFLLFENRIELMKQWRLIFEKIDHKIKQSKTSQNLELQSLAKTRYINLSFKDKVKLFAEYNIMQGSATNIDFVDYLFQCLNIVTKLPKFRSLSLYFIVTIFAYSESAFFFYSLLLLDIVNFESNMQNIVKSLTLNASQFGMSAVFAVLVIYLYTYVGFEIFNEDFYMWDIGMDRHRENACMELKQCFYTHFSFGPRSPGGIGDVMMDISYSDEKRMHYFVRYVYDLVFFILINIITLNIVFGTIIDSFASIRTEKNNLKQDMQDKCFICSLSRTLFDSVPNGFSDHKLREHNMWNYLYFLYNVRFKHRNKLMGIELYVSEQKNDLNLAWMPLMRAGRFKISKEHLLDARLKEVQAKLISLKESLLLANS